MMNDELGPIEFSAVIFCIYQTFKTMLETKTHLLQATLSIFCLFLQLQRRSDHWILETAFAKHEHKSQ